MGDYYGGSQRVSQQSFQSVKNMLKWTYQIHFQDLAWFLGHYTHLPHAIQFHLLMARMNNIN